MTAAPQPQLYTATTHRVTGRTDLLDALGPGGFAWFGPDEAFVTSGAVTTVAPEDTLAFLRSIERQGDAGGRGLRAVGALPFTGAGELLVPARIVERDAGGKHWSTLVEPAAHPPASNPAPRGHIARRFTVEARQSLDEWDEMVTTALGAIDARDLEKVVLAREVVVEADAPFEPATIVERLLATQPGCMVYAAGGFVGATPELLVRRRGLGHRVAADGRHRRARRITRSRPALDRATRVVGEDEPRASPRRRRGRG